MMSARCLCTGSSVVVMGGGLAEGVSGSTDMELEAVIRGRGSNVVVGETALLNSDEDCDDCALPQHIWYSTENSVRNVLNQQLCIAHTS